MINVQKLYKKFGKNQVLSGVDLEIIEGDVYAILGPNGSGKTTLIKAILGMVLPNSGTISVKKKPIKKAWHYRRDIDYLPQIARFPGNLTVKELIKMIKDIRGGKASREQELIDLFELKPFLSKKLSNLSGGTTQKVNIVLTFMFDSPLLILDEPTTGLDPVSLIHLKELIASEKAQGKTIVITSHSMSFVEAVTKDIVFLLEGKIYYKGSISALKKQTAQQDFEHAIASLLQHSYD
jgi:Cu-processing system ATP-binding protein